MLKIAWYENSIAERTHAIHNIVTNSATMKQVCVLYVFGPTWTPVDYDHPACVMSSSCLRCHALIWIGAVLVNWFVVRVRFFKIMWKNVRTYLLEVLLTRHTNVQMDRRRKNGNQNVKQRIEPRDAASKISCHSMHHVIPFDIIHLLWKSIF